MPDIDPDETPAADNAEVRPDKVEPMEDQLRDIEGFL
jgi:hypothetical protein